MTLNQHIAACVALAGSMVLGMVSMAGAQTSDRFGLNAHLRRDPGGPELLHVMVDGGFGSLRTGEEWRSIEKEKGVYATNAAMDRIIELAAQRKVAPLFLLAYGNPNYEDNLDPEAFANHALHVIDRYKDTVQYWQIWNEPQNFFFRKQYGGTWNGYEKDGSESPWVGKFAEFVTIVAERIKAKYPDIKLVAGTSSVVDVRLLRGYPAMWKQIDVLSIHPYTYKLPPEIQPFGGEKMLQRDGVAIAGPDHSFASTIGIYRDLLASLGRPDMPIWVTEFGYSTFVPNKPQTLWGGMTESTQAVYLARFGILSASLGVEKTFFYCLMDSGDGSHEVEHRFGLLRRDGSPKPSFLALKKLNSLMTGDTRPAKLDLKVNVIAPFPRTDKFVWDGQPIETLDLPQVHAFKRPDGKTVVFLWRPGRIYADLNEEQCDLDIPVGDRPARVVEIGRVGAGQPIRAETVQLGSLLKLKAVPYGADPVYVVIE